MFLDPRSLILSASLNTFRPPRFSDVNHHSTVRFRVYGLGFRVQTVRVVRKRALAGRSLLLYGIASNMTKCVKPLRHLKCQRDLMLSRPARPIRTLHSDDLVLLVAWLSGFTHFVIRLPAFNNTLTRFQHYRFACLTLPSGGQQPRCVARSGCRPVGHPAPQRQGFAVLRVPQMAVNASQIRGRE